MIVLATKDRKLADMLALQRGEKIDQPPTLYIQGTADVAHPRIDGERFVASYREAGGKVDLQLFEGEVEGFFVRRPDTPNAEKAIQMIIQFVHEHGH